MALTSGKKLGPYEIVAPAGAGGMGEVYRALDTRLNRAVAVKILPSHAIPFPSGQGKWQVSTAGGLGARWRNDGKEIFYVTIDRVLTAVAVTESAGQIRLGAAQPLFRVQSNASDVAPDGKRFLMNLAGDQDAKPITLVTNWTAGLKK